MIIISSYTQKAAAKHPQPGAFTPKFCPNSGCRLHNKAAGLKNWYIYKGVMQTIRHGIVHKYMCVYCCRSFTDSSFLSSYYEKKQVDMNRVMSFATRSISLRHWAESVEVNPGVLKLRLCKLGVLLLDKVIQQGCWYYAAEVLIKVTNMRESGVTAYCLLRELIVSLLEVLTVILDFSGEPLRVFCREFEQESVLTCLRGIFCKWAYGLLDSHFYIPAHQLE